MLEVMQLVYNYRPAKQFQWLTGRCYFIRRSTVRWTLSITLFVDSIKCLGSIVYNLIRFLYAPPDL